LDIFNGIDIADILKDSIIIVGTIEFIKNVITKKRLCTFCIWQIIFCLIFSINHAISATDFTLSVVSVLQIIYGSMTLIAGSTLAYDLIIDKFKIKK
jgi:hypothetical protein